MQRPVIIGGEERNWSEAYAGLHRWTDPGRGQRASHEGHGIKKLVDEDYPEVLVMDNLNTHKLSSLYA